MQPQAGLKTRQLIALTGIIVIATSARGYTTQIVSAPASRYNRALPFERQSQHVYADLPVSLCIK